MKRLTLSLAASALVVTGCSAVEPVTTVSSAPTTPSAIITPSSSSSNTFHDETSLDEDEYGGMGDEKYLPGGQYAELNYDENGEVKSSLSESMESASPASAIDISGITEGETMMALNSLNVIPPHPSPYDDMAFPETPKSIIQDASVRNEYTEEEININSDNAIVDMVVTPYDAWGSGAHKWDQDKRVAFASDPLNHAITTANTVKDKTLTRYHEWKAPSVASQCRMAGRVIAVKAKYGLSVTLEEKEQLNTMVESCALTHLPTA